MTEFVQPPDFECPKCKHTWNNEGDIYKEGHMYEEQCPSCGADLEIWAYYSVDYEVELKESQTTIVEPKQS